MNKKFRGTPVNALPVKDNPSGSDVVLAEDSENKFSKIKIPVSALSGGEEYIQNVDIASTSFSRSTTYPLSILVSSINGKFKYIIENYAAYASIIFWEFLRDDEEVFADLRFTTTLELDNYLNTIVSDSGSGNINMSLRIRCYIKQKMMSESLNKIVSYNGLISKLKGGGKLQDRRLVTLYNVQNMGREHPAVTSFLSIIYSHFLGVTSEAQVMKNTIGIPSSYNKLYNLIATKHNKGRSYTISSINPTGKMVYDSVDDAYILFQDIAPAIHNEMFYLNSTVISENPSLNTFSNYQEMPGASAYIQGHSAVRVYHLVDNLLNPRYHYFMVKPIGVDQFIIPYIKDYTVGTKLKCGVVISQKHNRFKLHPLPVAGDPSLATNHNRLFRIRTCDIPFSTAWLRSNSISINDKSSFRFFVYDETSGICSQFTEQFDVLFKVAGATIKIMPNRNVRNNK